MRLGLIEAASGKAARHQEKLYPRRMRLGLIEAVLAGGSGVGLQSIRGACASASLKLHAGYSDR